MKKSDEELLLESFYIIEGFYRTYRWQDNTGSVTQRIQELISDLEQRLNIKLTNKLIK